MSRYYAPIDFDLRHDKKLILAFVDGHVQASSRMPSALLLSDLNNPPTVASGSILNSYRADNITNMRDGETFPLNDPTKNFGGAYFWNESRDNRNVTTLSGGVGPAYKAKGLNGRPCVSFNNNGLRQMFVANTLIPKWNTSIFIAFATTDDDAPLINTNNESANSTMYPWFGVTGGQASVKFFSGSGGRPCPDYIQGGTVNDGKPHQMEIWQDPHGTNTHPYAVGIGERRLYVDGRLIKQDDYVVTNFSYAVWIGLDNGSRKLVGDIGEILFYDKPLNDADRNMIEDYLFLKYGTDLVY